MSKPWECIRCYRINAPFNPVCFCNKEDSPNIVRDQKITESIKIETLFDAHHFEDRSGLETKIVHLLLSNNFRYLSDLQKTNCYELSKIRGIGYVAIAWIVCQANKFNVDIPWGRKNYFVDQAKRKLNRISSSTLV